MRIERIEPGPGQESVWDYPRPPRVEPVEKRIEVHFGGVKIADTRDGYRVLETSHPPVYYLPRKDVLPDILKPADKRPTYCEFKGVAVYYAVEVGDHVAPLGAWAYPEPVPAFEAISDCVGFYAGAMDACYVGGERVAAQDGGFYGGWITADVVGPFKGGPGTWGW